jgi:pyruvate dehydrogenase E2 component (dihydrolipoamide acetyltransferase)
MAEVILMPRLSDTMTEGVIAAWHKNVGDAVKKGDLLAEIETDKATMELESYQEGVLLHIGTTKGGKLQVNDLLAIIGKAGEDVASLIASVGAGSPAAAPATEQVPAAATVAPVAASASPALDVAAMDEVVLMPRLSDTMTEGVIAGWQKNVGDSVKKGDVLADIETDKATMELESYKDGILLYQGANAGEKILVNDLLCVIGAAGTNVDAIVAAVKSGAGATAPAASNAAPAASPAVSSAPAANAPAPAAPAVQAVVNEGRIFASPLAKKMAEERGIDLKYVKGTGDNGRITKFDIDGYVPATASAASAPQAVTAASAPQVAAGVVSFEDQPVSQMRKTIARRLSESLFTAPHFYITMSIDMDAAVAARAKINEVAPVKISFNDMVVKATALSLKQHPKINSS